MIALDSERKTWIVSCDICESEVERLRMFRGRMVDNDGIAWTVGGAEYEIPHNHHVVCGRHEFDTETGEWV